MSKYENITVEEPQKIDDGQWTCSVTWSGPSCRGSESIRKPRSTHLEAKRDAEVIASRLRSQNATAVSKGDMPLLPAPISAYAESEIADEEDRVRDQASQSEIAKLEKEIESLRLNLREVGAAVSDALKAARLPKTFTVKEAIYQLGFKASKLKGTNESRMRKDGELEAIAKALDCERSDTLEKIADLKEKLAKESQDANHYAALAGSRTAEIGELRKKIEEVQEHTSRSATEVAWRQRDEARAELSAVKSFIRSMGIEPGEDLQADLSECLAKHAKQSQDLDAATKWRVDSLRCLEILAKAGIDATTPSQGARMVASKIEFFREQRRVDVAQMAEDVRHRSASADAYNIKVDKISKLTEECERLEHERRSDGKKIRQLTRALSLAAASLQSATDAASH